MSKYIRKQYIHGGVGVLCRDDENVTEVDYIRNISVDLHFEAAAAFMSDTNMLVVALYRSGLGDFDGFLSKLDQMLTYCMTKYSPTVRIIVGGDFNVHFSTNTNRALEVVNMMNSFDLHKTIFQPTRLNSTIDNIFTNVRNYEVGHMKANISDHEAQLLEFSLINPLSNEPRTFGRRFTRNNTRQFLNALLQEQ